LSRCITGGFSRMAQLHEVSTCKEDEMCRAYSTNGGEDRPLRRPRHGSHRDMMG
jgi:hypothetical protein